MLKHLRRPLRPTHLRIATLAASLALAAVMLLLVGAMLWTARTQTWTSAERNSNNIRQSIIGEIQSQLDLYSTMLDVAAGLLSGPESARLSQDTILQTLKRMDRSFDVAGLIVVINKEGHAVLASSGLVDQSYNLADRPYFQVHRDRADVGLYLSQPFRSRLRNDEPTIAISRRISDANGAFAGVVVAAIKLKHFQTLFSRIHLGASSALSLVNAEGVVLMRDPSTDGKGDIGHDVSRGVNFGVAKTSTSGSHVADAAIDGVERLISFGWVEGYPLLVNVSVSTTQILAGWWHQAIVVCGSSLVVCGAVVALALGLRRKIDQLETAKYALFQAASTDQLTGLANRREFDALVGREWQRALRERTRLAVLMIDADHFKRVNDEFGHAEGDDVLKAVALAIRDSLKRPGDVAARYGGEEFAIVLPNTDSRGALTVAETVREAVASASQEARGKGRAGVTVSIGAASMVPSATETPARLIETADRALYEAKRRGRNQAWSGGPENGTVIPLRSTAR